MEQKPTDKNRASTGNSREERLKAALKANMARRKAQARARSAPQGEGDAQSDISETGKGQG